MNERKNKRRNWQEFRTMLFNAHRHSLATQLRDYINAIEAKEIAANALTDEKKELIEWARQRADWYDPTIRAMEDDVLNDVDIENLRPKDSYIK